VSGSPPNPLQFGLAKQRYRKFSAIMMSLVRANLQTSGPRVGSVVLGHRIFSGYTTNGFEVRSVHELQHLITQGDATILGQQIRIRPAGELTAAAMQSFLSNRVFHDKLFEAMMPHEDTWDLKSLTIIDQTYHDPRRLATAFGLAAAQPDAAPG
jgi:hypothetical protein